MATPLEIEQLKKITNGAVGYTDVQLSDLLDASSQREVAHMIWQETAASYSTLVNVSESGSSRSLGDLQKNALAMAQQYAPLSVQQENLRPRSRKIVRG